MDLTSSAKDPLKPNQNPGMELTDTLPHTPPTVDTLLTVHTPTDVTDIVLTDTDGKNYLKKIGQVFIRLKIINNIF